MALQLAALALQTGHKAWSAIKENDLAQAAYYDQRRQARIQTRDRNTELLKSHAQTIERVRGANQSAANQYFALVDQGIDQLDYNAEFLRDLWQNEQLSLQEIENQLAFRDQSDEITLAKKSGLAAARGVTGVTAGRLERQPAVQLGLNRAQRARSLTGQIDAMDLRMERGMDQNRHQAESIGKRGSILPTLGKVPEMQALYKTPYIQKPSSSKMWHSLIETGIGAAETLGSMYFSGKANLPKSGGGTDHKAGLAGSADDYLQTVMDEKYDW